jgi:hypothetical protein
VKLHAVGFARRRLSFGQSAFSFVAGRARRSRARWHTGCLRPLTAIEGLLSWAMARPRLVERFSNKQFEPAMHFLGVLVEVLQDNPNSLQEG